MKPLSLACPFCERALTSGLQRFVCHSCDEALLGGMPEPRRRGFHLNQNPWAFAPRQVMTPSEVGWFNRLSEATANFTQEIEVLDPGDPDDENDRNPHTILLPIPTRSFRDAAEIDALAESAISAAASAQRETAGRTVLAHRSRLEYEIKTAQAEADELMAVMREGIPIDSHDLVTARLLARRKTEELDAQTKDDAIEAATRRMFPFDPKWNILRLRRTVAHITMAVAVRFPSTEWEFFEPVAMSEEELAERARMISEAMVSRGDSVRVDETPARPSAAPVATPG